MILISLNNLDPQYTSNLFTRVSQLTSRNLKNTHTYQDYQGEAQKVVKNVSHLEVPSYGMGSQLSVSKYPP